jgi:hypothetical protein
MVVPALTWQKQAVRRRWRALGFLIERSSVKVQLPSKTGLERRTSKARTNAGGRRLRETGRWHQVVCCIFRHASAPENRLRAFQVGGRWLQRPHE